MAHFPDPVTSPSGCNLFFVPSALGVTLADGEPLEADDELAAFDGNGTCVGRLVYAGETDTISFAVAGVEPPASDGMTAGEAFTLRFWNDSLEREALAGFTFEPCGTDSGPLCQDENAYVEGGLYTLATLDTTTPEGSDQLELIDVSPRSAVGLIWSAVVPDDAIEFQVLRRSAGADSWNTVQIIAAGTPSGAPRRMEYLDAAAPVEQLEYAVELVRSDNPSLITEAQLIDNTAGAAGGSLGLRRVVQVQSDTDQVVTVRLWDQDSELVDILFDDVAEAGVTTTVLIPDTLEAGPYLVEATGASFRQTTMLEVV